MALLSGKEDTPSSITMFLLYFGLFLYLFSWAGVIGLLLLSRNFVWARMNSIENNPNIKISKMISRKITGITILTLESKIVQMQKKESHILHVKAKLMKWTKKWIWIYFQWWRIIFIMKGIHQLFDFYLYYSWDNLSSLQMTDVSIEMKIQLKFEQFVHTRNFIFYDCLKNNNK